MTVRGAVGGFPAGFYNVTATKWCRHNGLFRSYSIVAGAQHITCSNCGAVGVGRGLQAAGDALMKIEKVAAVSEVAT